MKRDILEPIGKRIARLRQENGYTQQSLAERLAMSRVAVSHIEMDLTLPSERTITLLAGLFKQSPYKLVAGSTYPLAKTERLPATACAYTQFEFDLALCQNDLNWLARLMDEGGPTPAWHRHYQAVNDHWCERFAAWEQHDLSEQEKNNLSAVRRALHDLV